MGHVRRLLTGERGIPYTVGGSLSEDDWRKEFRAAGLPVRAPKFKDVEVGIDRVYGAFQRHGLFVFDDLTELWDELTTYSREVDEAGNATEKIQAKETFHLLDAMRYIVSDLQGKPRTMGSGRVDFYGKREWGTEIRGRRTEGRSAEEIEEMLGGE
jgi:hypothetical protein